MSYQEWEVYKEQEQRNKLNNEAINHVYASSRESSADSFSSCYSSDNDDRHSKDKSDVCSLNDTWEMQEKMLLMAERLERGEDIPELGICHNSLRINHDKSK